MRGVDADDEHGDYEDNDNDEYDNDDAEDEDDADAPGKRRLPQGKSCIFCRVISSGENPHHLTIILKRLCKHHRHANDNAENIWMEIYKVHLIFIQLLCRSTKR